jgi:hypothetical protein
MPQVLLGNSARSVLAVWNTSQLAGFLEPFLERRVIESGRGRVGARRAAELEARGAQCVKGVLLARSAFEFPRKNLSAEVYRASNSC